MIPVFAPWLSENVRRYVLDCVDSGWISSLGQYVGRFERDFATFCEARHAVATSNGTTALHLCLATLEIGAGDEVLVPDLTFVSTANVVRLHGRDPGAGGLRTAHVGHGSGRRAPKAHAAHPGHHPGPSLRTPGGHGSAPRPGGRAWAGHRRGRRRGARGALQGQRVGALGRIGAFSFYGNKIITTGEGGMVVTNDPGWPSARRSCGTTPWIRVAATTIRRSASTTA